MSNLRPQAGPPADKLIIFDDDPYFGTLISAIARQYNFAAHYFQSLYAMGSFSRIRNYDIAIIDIYMDSIRGDELAAYIDMFCSDIPVILVSGQGLEHRDGRTVWPQSVRAFIPKAAGAHQILAAARATLTRERMLKRLASGHAPSDLVDLMDPSQAAPAGML
jgi:DNA-binding response OmpR family regulator